MTYGSIAPYVGSPIAVIRRMLQIARLKPGETLMDLGSGDGRVLIIAAREFGANAIGVEIRPDLAKQAQQKIEQLNLGHRVKVLNMNMFDADISQADVITLYLTTSGNQRLRPKLEKELKPGARVVSHDFEVPGWKPTYVETFRENPHYTWTTHTIYLYKPKPQKF